MKLVKLAKVLSLALLLGVSSLSAKVYIVDNVHSTIGFKVRHMMVASVRGHFTDFEGKYDYDPVKRVIHSLDGTVKVSSITTGDAMRDKHLKSKDFFDAQHFPIMKLSLIKHNGSRALIKLTIKGITKKINFNVDFLGGESKDPYGAIKSGFELSGKISRKAYNIMFHKALETGGVAVGDEVKISLEIEGVYPTKK